MTPPRAQLHGNWYEGDDDDVAQHVATLPDLHGFAGEPIPSLASMEREVLDADRHAAACCDELDQLQRRESRFFHPAGAGQVRR